MGNLHVNGYLRVNSCKFTGKNDFVVNLLVNSPGDLLRKLNLEAFIQNGLNCRRFHILIFSCATRGHFPNVNTVLTSLAARSKKCHTDF